MGRLGRKATRNGWLPNHHGAWGMLAIPFGLGALIGVPRPGVALSLAITWFVGYFSYFAACLWLKVRWRTALLRPVAVYGVISALAGVTVLLQAPRLAQWAPVFLPLAITGLTLAAVHRERSLASGVVMTVAASLMLPVAAGYSVMDVAAGLRAANEQVTHALVSTVAVAAYFVGTVFVVKTLIRKRGDAGFARLSVGYHAAMTVAFAVAWYLEWCSAWFMVFAAFLALRSWVAGQLSQRRIPPRIIGRTEIGVSLVLVALVLATAP